MAYLQLNNLNFSYNQSENILKNINFSIEKGEILAILGESGSGKSTLLRLISGFETAQEGALYIDNKKIFEGFHKVPVEKRGIGFVFQDYALFPHLTVEENIKFGLDKLNKKEKEQRVEKMLQLVSLKDFSKKYPHELSGGQQQRIALARALAPEPKLILFDEPFSNLDANLQGKIREELKEILKNTETTALFVSHNKEDALHIADKAIILYKGDIVQEGNPQEIYDNPKTPYVAHLFGIN